MKTPELCRLVIGKIESTPLTARQLFDVIRIERPSACRSGFKSFVQIINRFDGIRTETLHKGAKRVYLVK